MKKEQVGEMLDFLSACYPNSQIKPEYRQKMFEVWANVFAHTEYEIAMAAAREIATKSKWFPSVADIMNEINGSKGDGIPWRIAPQ